MKKNILSQLSFAFISLAMVLAFASLMDIFPSFSTNTFIFLILGVILFDSYMNKSAIESRLEELSFQIAEGNPNAVFKLSGQNQTFANLARGAQSDLLLVGSSFVGFLSTESHLIIQSLEKGVKVRIVLLDPNSETLLQYQAQSIGPTYEPDLLKKDIEYSLSQLEKIKQLTNKLSGTLEIRVTQNYLSTTGLKIDGGRSDGTLLISLIAADPTGITGGPYFVINKRSSNELFVSFSKSLEAIWEKSRERTSDNLLP